MFFHSRLVMWCVGSKIVLRLLQDQDNPLFVVKGSHWCRHSAFWNLSLSKEHIFQNVKWYLTVSICVASWSDLNVIGQRFFHLSVYLLALIKIPISVCWKSVFNVKLALDVLGHVIHWLGFSGLMEIDALLTYGKHVHKRDNPEPTIHRIIE